MSLIENKSEIVLMFLSSIQFAVCTTIRHAYHRIPTSSHPEAGAQR